MTPHPHAPTVAVHGAAHSARCANCNSALPPAPPPYCPQCGQETHLHPPTFFEFVHEFVGHYVALEGALWRSLLLLLLRPGRLTLEYLAGRRRRYVLPLRLYISASFLFFLCVKLLGGDGGTALVQVRLGTGADGKPLAAASAERAELAAKLQACAAPGSGCGWLRTQALTTALRAMDQAGDGRSIEQRATSMAPYAVFLMLPLFAALLKLAYLRRGLPYGAHFVFGLHIHAFWFLAMLPLALPLPETVGPWQMRPDVIGPLMLLAIAIYGVSAMRRVYGGRWSATVARAACVTVAYTLAISVVSVALLIVALTLR